MSRLIKTLFIPCFGPWLFVMAAQPLAAQQAGEMPAYTIRIAELGLEDQVPSAVGLVGPEDGKAARNRAALVHRLQCWIDGVESCTFADRNDPRIRAIRRFLVTGPVDRDSAIVVDFPDRTRVDLRLARESDPDPNDWDQRVYELVVLHEKSVQAQGQPRYTHDEQY